ncbi:MAG: hypothetical protein ACR65O_06535 [Methylomicrobium sp.]|jgi:hypothetical protein
MKNHAAKIYLSLIFSSAIFAIWFVYSVSVKDTSLTQTQAVQYKSLATAEKNIPTKRDSFTAGKAFGEKKGSYDSMETMVGRGKNYLLAKVKDRLNQLEPFRTRVNNITTLNDSEKKGLVSELNAEIAMFEALKSEISKSATKQDIQHVADKIKAEWIKSRLSVARAEKQIVAARETQLIADANKTSSNMQKRIDELKASGKETKSHEKLLSAYGKKMTSAKQDIDSAKEKLDAVASASTENEKLKLIKEKNVLLMSASDSMKDAYMMVKDEARREFSQRFK